MKRSLSAEHVADLQYFLMDAAKRYVVARGKAASAAGDLLGSAAALDYVLLLASQHPNETLDEAAATTDSMCATMTRAAVTALDFIATMLDASDELFDDFVERHIGVNGVFDLLRALREGGIARSDDITFRTLTLANDILERRRQSR